MVDISNIVNIKKKILAELKNTREKVETYNNTKKKVSIYLFRI
jgi:hypothetical protein